MAGPYQEPEYLKSAEPAILPDTQEVPLTNVDSADLDGLQLHAQGHQSELVRRFSFFQLLSFAFSIMISWITWISVLLTTLLLGGPPGSFWSPWVSCATSFIMTLGLAELASAYPSTGGPYHFAFMIAPVRYRAGAAFVIGWINSVAYLFSLASGTNFLAYSILGLASIYNESYVSEKWHIWLLYVLLIIIPGAIVTILPASVPRTQSALLWLSLVGMVVIAITMLAVSPTKASASTVFVTVQNESGWSDGWAFMLAVGQSTWLFSAIDCATHLAEEIPKPGRNVPLVMLASMVVGIITSIIFSLAILFSTTDFTAVTTSPFPIYTAFAQVVPGGVAMFFAIWALLVSFGSSFSLVVTCGRILWAFARDNALPYSNVFQRVHPRLLVPVETNIVTCVFAIAFGAIAIGSSTAFNTFISSAILLFNLSYAIPQAFVIFRRDQLPKRSFNLGPILGPFCNIFSVAWALVCTVLYCFPLFLPVTVETMNYVSVVMAGLILFTACLWFLGGKRKTFTGPQIDLDILNVLQLARNSQKDPSRKE